MTLHSRSGWTLFWHGIYVSVVALSLFLAPGAVRLFLPFPTELDWWNRALAVPVFNLGILCIGVALTGSRSLIRLSVAMRLWVAAILAIVVAIGLMPPITLTIGAIDLLSAALTALALKIENNAIDPSRSSERMTR
jgi:hypothetical protein